MGTHMALSGALISAAGIAAADSVPAMAMQRFADHCFSPFMTAERVDQKLSAAGIRTDFYDLNPFSDVAPSPATGRAVTDGTDRRCEVAFDGIHAKAAAQTAVDALAKEGITDPADVPVTHTATQGTELLAARYLNPNRIAVVHVGTRPGPNDTETFMTVERLTPSEPTN